jgi:two-component system phosphate regulon response regulator PhoB
MLSEKILVVDDEEDILELVGYNLEKSGYRVDRAETGEEALRMVSDRRPDLVILDLMLPGINGLEVCRILKANPKTVHLPILMLTAKGSESDVVRGFELGASDYVTKPFSTKILLARVRAALKKGAGPESKPTDAVRIHNLVVVPQRNFVSVDGKPIQLTLSEFRLLVLLARQPGVIFSRYQIVDQVRGENHSVTDRSVDVHVVSLRKKLGSAGHLVETVRGMGYRMKEEP